MAPAYKDHPKGGHIVLFATGRILTTTDQADASTYYAYGIWDRPDTYSTNNTLVTQTLTETTFGSTRVRTATTTQPNWSVGQDVGWQVALPTGGERVVGDGAFVSDTVFVFVSTNPATNLTSLPHGANWWMQLDALSGGAPVDPAST